MRKLILAISILLCGCYQPQAPQPTAPTIINNTPAEPSPILVAPVRPPVIVGPPVIVVPGPYQHRPPHYPHQPPHGNGIGIGVGGGGVRVDIDVDKK